MPRWQANQSRRPRPWLSVAASNVHSRKFVKQTVSLRSCVSRPVSLRAQLVLLAATFCILLSSVSVFAQRRKSRATRPSPLVVAVDATGLQALLKRGDEKDAK